MDDLVSIKNDESVCTSLQIAEKFGKRHDHVVRDIENLLVGLPKSGDTYFGKSSYKNEQNGQEYPMYYMNRDGFSLLVMGFKWKKALEWKFRVIRLACPVLQNNERRTGMTATLYDKDLAE